MIAESFTKILRDGPEVSFNGSPTVSPITAASCSGLCFSDYLVTILPSLSSSLIVNFSASIYFFALSQAPPVLLAEIAI